MEIYKYTTISCSSELEAVNKKLSSEIYFDKSRNYHLETDSLSKISIIGDSCATLTTSAQSRPTITSLPKYSDTTIKIRVCGQNTLKIGHRDRRER